MSIVLTSNKQNSNNRHQILKLKRQILFHTIHPAEGVDFFLKLFRIVSLVNVKSMKSLSIKILHKFDSIWFTKCNFMDFKLT